MDASEQRIADSLVKHAADAPSDHDLLSIVHTRLRRRRTGQVVGAAVLAVAVAAAGITAAQTTRTEPQPAPQPQPVQVGPAAPGWRWESYKTVQIQVPDAWQKWVDGPAACMFMPPSVGRLQDWQPRDRAGCGYAVHPLKDRQPYVWFNDVQEPTVKQYDGGWSEETRLVNGVKVSVLASSEELRNRIMGTARPIIGTDSYGCSPTDPRPSSEVRSDEVSGAEICEYHQGSLIGSSHLPPRLAGQLGKALQVDAAKPKATPIPGCSSRGARSYVITLHAGDKTWTTRLESDPCTVQRLDSFAIIRRGPHSNYDPSRTVTPAGVGPKR